MKMREARKIARKFCKENRIELLLDWKQCKPNEGAYADSTIWIGKVKDPYIFCVILCHEIGHCIDDRSCVWRRGFMKKSRISGELTAWAHVPELINTIFGIRLSDKVAKLIGNFIASYQHDC